MSARTAELAGELVDLLRGFVGERSVTYDEYRAVKAWLIEVGTAGEWPLVLDVFLESAVEERAFANRAGSPGAIEGPYYLPRAPLLEAPYELPRRPDEPGAPLVLRGRVVSSSGAPLPGAVLDVWQADASGDYSGFSEAPEGNLRGKLVAGEDGRYEVRTVRPAPYTIPLDGPTGRVVAAAGWNAWRPAHVHVKVTADGHEPLTTQLTFADSEHLDDDPARAVKDELLVRPVRENGASVVEYDFMLASGEHALAGPAPDAAAGGLAEGSRVSATPALPPPALAPEPARRTWRPALPAERAPRFGAPRGGTRAAPGRQPKVR